MPRPFTPRPARVGSLTSKIRRHVLSSYFQYHHRTTTHLSLDKDCPQPRPIQPPQPARLSPSRRWAVCIIATSVAPPELRGQRTDTRRFRCEGSLHFQPLAHTRRSQNFHSFRTARKRPRRTHRPMNSTAIICSPIPRPNTFFSKDNHINEPSCAREKFRGDYALEASLFTKPPTPVKSVVISRSHSRSGQLRY
jgi:hypothetical protein